MSASVRSATASLSTPGVLHTAMPRAVAAPTSTLLYPTPKFEIALSRGAARSSASSIGNCALQSNPSASVSPLRTSVRSPRGSTIRTSHPSAPRPNASASSGNATQAIGFGAVPRSVVRLVPGGSATATSYDNPRPWADPGCDAGRDQRRNAHDGDIAFALQLARIQRRPTGALHPAHATEAPVSSIAQGGSG